MSKLLARSLFAWHLHVGDEFMHGSIKYKVVSFSDNMVAAVVAEV